MQVREATLADLEVLVEGNQRLAEETEDLKLESEKLRPGIGAVLEKDVAGQYFVAEGEEGVRGQIMVTYEWSDWRCANLWWIQSVYVWAPFRGTGVFRAMYRAIEGKARESGAAGLRLYVETDNRRAIGVYEKVGMARGRYHVMEHLFTEH